MVRFRVALPSVRRWAGLLAVLTLALCTAGIPQSALETGPMAMTAMAAPAEPATTKCSEGPEAGEVAEPACPMARMDCAPQAQQRSPADHLQPAGSAPATAVHLSPVPVGAKRIPPVPVSREGPDLNRLCVSRT